MADFNLQKLVMKEASEVPCYWPNFDATKTQQALQGPAVEDGTYILRPTGDIDVAKKKFLTLSVRMDFESHHTSNVCHFPVIVDAGMDRGRPAVYFSLTQYFKATSLEKLLDYYHDKPIHGQTPKGECFAMIKYGLPYLSEAHAASGNGKEKPKPPGRKLPLAKNYTTTTLPRTLNQPNTPKVYPRSNTLPRDLALMASAPVTSPTTCPSSNTLPRSFALIISASESSPKVFPRSNTSPRDLALLTLTPDLSKGIPIPSPRTHVPAPHFPAPLTNPKPQPDSDSSRPSSETDCSTSSEDNGKGKGNDALRECEFRIPKYVTKLPEQCECGIPKHATKLPEEWTVHRSLIEETRNMLYFRDPNGQTAWALPPWIDNACGKREYLEYGRLNVQCFNMYSAHLKYSSSSELSNFRNYEMFPSKAQR